MELDNPIWHSLASRHKGVALGTGLARRYPPEVAPFVAVESANPGAAESVTALVAPGEKIAMGGVIPPLDQGWSVQDAFQGLQFVWPSNVEPEPEGSVERLSEEHLARMLDLTALVYPAYFRPGIARLGDYFGIFQDGELCAMAGIRMAMEGYQELSAICTHPDHRGKGYAARLTLHLVRHILLQGDRPFLHTESENLAAQSLYRKLGFVVRKELPIRVFLRESD